MIQNTNQNKSILQILILVILVITIQIVNTEPNSGFETATFSFASPKLMRASLGKGLSWGVQNVNPRQIGDVDGDGIDDIVAFGSSTTYTCYGTDRNSMDWGSVKSNYFAVAGAGFDYTSWDRYPRWMADIDGDGKADICAFAELGMYVGFSTGKGNFEDPVLFHRHYTPSEGGWVSYTAHPRIFGDVNGDGKEDLCVFGSSHANCLLSGGRSGFSGSMSLNGFHTADGWTDSNIEPVYVADLDGNGCGDVVGIATDGVYVAWSNCSSFSPKEKIPSITSFSKDATWSSFNTYPRWFKDMNGDGKADLIGFSCCGVHITYSNGKTFLPSKTFFEQTFSQRYGWDSYDNYPRMIGDFDGDGYNDIIGFSSRGIEVAFNVINCIHSTRDPQQRCSCKDGYYDKQDGQACGECYRKCGTCEDNTQNCNTCYNSTRTGTNCDCISTYYDDGSSKSCIACVFPCKTCSSQTTCQTCSQINRTAPECDCDVGYYEKDGNCLKCDYKCNSCTGSSTNCTSCSHSTRNDSNSDCLCKNNWFNVDQVQQCTACVFPCVTCTSLSNCLTCNGSNRTQPQCDCNDGYFQNSSNVCQICDNTLCGTCTSLTDCIVSCDSTCKTCNLDGTCKTCVDGKFLINGTCQSCTNTVCATCVTSSTQCIDSCNSTCKTCLPNKLCDSCVDGKFLNSSKACQICDNTQCGTCQSSSTNCIKACNSDCQTCNIDGTCNTCNDGKYLKNGACLNCDHNVCGTCQNTATQCIQSCGTNCKSCLINTLCNSCVEGRYLSNGDCLLCDNKVCGTCQNTATSCIKQCNSDCQTCNLDGSCSSCQLQKYLKNGACLPCDNSSCATCQNLATTCIESCNSDCLTCQSDKTCLTCQQGKYLKQGQCLSCDNSVCGTCSNTPIQCIKQCNSDCKTCSIDGLCISCKANEFLKDGKCLLCDNKVCGQCQNSATTCTVSCLSSCVTCNTNGQCNSCEDGQFIELGGCSYCDNTKCGTCITSNDNCIQQCNSTCKTCLTNGNCKDCNFGFYLDGNQCNICDHTKCATCITSSTNCIDDCNSTCKTCLSNKICDSCIDGKFLSNGICEICDDTKCGTCQTTNDGCVKACNSDCTTCNIDGTCKSCQIGQYLKNGQCLPCDQSKCATCQNESDICILSCNSDCKTCLTNQLCDSCDNGLFLESGNCQICDNTLCATCVNTASQCILSCNSDCKTCDVDGTCLSCDLDEYLDNGKCQKCNYQYQQCVGQADNCTVCSDITRQQPTLNNNKCECKQKFFDVGVAVCEPCHFKCGSCKITAENCIACSDESRSMIQTDPDLSICSCANGYYDEPSTGDCLKCKHQNCNCRSEYICYECTGDDYMYRSIPTCDCKTGYYQDNSDNICKQCNDLCLNCNNQNTCIACIILSQAPQLINLGQEKACGCPEQYYLEKKENGQYNCKQCDPQCQLCDSEGICYKCLLQDRQAPDCKKPVEFQQSSVFSFSMVDNAGNIQEVQGKCNINCDSCDNAPSNCTSCNISPFRNNNPPICSCKKGYYDEQGSLKYCQKCSDNCHTCDYEKLCNSCIPGQNRQLDKFSKSCECQKGFTELKTQPECVKCYQYQDNCLQQCPKNTIQDETTYICIDILVNEQNQSQQILIYVLGAVILAQILIFACFSKFTKKLIFKANQKKFKSCNQQDNSLSKSDSKEINMEQDQKV